MSLPEEPSKCSKMKPKKTLLSITLGTTLSILSSKKEHKWTKKIKMHYSDFSDFLLILQMELTMSFL